MSTFGVRLVKVSGGHGCLVQLDLTTVNTYCRSAGKAGQGCARPCASGGRQHERSQVPGPAVQSPL
jgi:hypothetical protein